MPTISPTAVKLGGLIVALGLFGSGPGTTLIDEALAAWKKREGDEDGVNTDPPESTDEAPHFALASETQVKKPAYEPLVVVQRRSTGEQNSSGALLMPVAPTSPMASKHDGQLSYFEALGFLHQPSKMKPPIEVIPPIFPYTLIAFRTTPPFPTMPLEAVPLNLLDEAAINVGSPTRVPWLSSHETKAIPSWSRSAPMAKE